MKWNMIWYDMKWSLIWNIFKLFIQHHSLVQWNVHPGPSETPFFCFSILMPEKVLHNHSKNLPSFLSTLTNCFINPSLPCRGRKIILSLGIRGLAITFYPQDSVLFWRATRHSVGPYLYYLILSWSLSMICFITCLIGSYFSFKITECQISIFAGVAKKNAFQVSLELSTNSPHELGHPHPHLAPLKHL